MDNVRKVTKEYGQYPEYSDIFRQDEPMIGLKTALGGNPLRVDRTGDASRTRVSVMCVRMVGTASRQLCSCFLTWMGMPST